MRWVWRLVDRWLSPEVVDVPLEELATLWLPRHHEDARESPVAAGGDAERDRAPLESEVRVPKPTSKPKPKPQTAVRVMSEAHTPDGPVREGATPPRRNPSLREQFLVPHEKALRRQGVWDPVQALVAILEEHGQCPSVVMVQTDHDRESGQELFTLRETLARVTLYEHTELVTHLLLQEILNRYPDPDVLIPKMLVAVLGHDIGKIPAFRGSGAYSKKDHPDISVVKVRELFHGLDVPWLDDACELIRTHHQWTKSEHGGLLKRCDGKARELEVARITKTLVVKRWEEWFSVERLLDVLAPTVNRVNRRGQWQAFEFGDSVFCVPDVVLEATRDLAKAERVIDIHVTRETDKEVVLRHVMSELRAADVLSYPVGEGFYGRKFSVTLPATRRKSGVSQWYLVPLMRSAFGEREGQFQKVEHSLLEGVRNVELVA